jgi:multiple sugar transport system substrate-binding protein
MLVPGGWRTAIAVVLMVLSLAGTASSAGNSGVTIQIGHRWDAANKFHMGLQQAADIFVNTYPNTTVEVAPGWTEDKYKVAVAVGEAPDAYVLWDAPTWGEGGYIQPLDTLNAKYGVKREGFIPAVWDMSVWRGSVYALQLQTDPNFGLVWNKRLFAEVGLDPERAPRTVQEFDQYFKRLTEFASDGTATRIGMVPWTLTGGNANTVFTWGWLFGGEWYDYNAGRATAHEPGNIKALEYLTEYWERYEPARAALSQGLATGMNRFTSGREVMQLMTPSNTFLTMKSNPDMSIGLARMFNNPEAGVENATWVGGWGIGLTSGTKVAEAAYQFMRFITSGSAGVAAFCEAGQWMPGSIGTPYFRNLGRDPQWRVFAETIVNATKYRPAIPALGLYTTRLGQLFPQVLRRQVTPGGAMEELSRQIDAEMAEKYGVF